MDQIYAKLPQIIVICGPTASGKSEIAVKLAQKIGAEIVSADSMQIYRQLSVGTAKPSVEEMGGVPHYMIDCCSPKTSFSVSDYEHMAVPIVRDILSRGKIVIICGGTGFYINSVLFPHSYGNAGGEKTHSVRVKYEKMAEECGNEAVYEVLCGIDPITAEKLHPNDRMRVIRALEIYETTGKKKSEIIDDTAPRFSYLAFMPNYDRETLYKRINERVDKMIARGWVEEVKNLLNDGLTVDMQSMVAIGYREIAQLVLNNEDMHITTRDIIKQGTRNYAKRQITFFKKLPDLNYLDMNSGVEGAIDQIEKELLKYSEK